MNETQLMTVGELIKALQNIPPETLVGFVSGDKLRAVSYLILKTDHTPPYVILGDAV